MPRIIIQKKSGTWWKVLLGVFLGFVTGAVAVVGGVAGAAAFVKTGDIITLTGNDPNKILTETYQQKTVLDIVMDAVGGKIKVETLGDIADITPAIDTYINNLSEQLNDLGCELTKEEIYSWPLTQLSDNLINSVKEVELIHFLSKDKTSDPDPIVKYLCYKTDSEGNYEKDSEDKLIPLVLSNMLDDSSFLQTKIDTMRISTLFTEEEIEKSSMLKAIKDKTVKDLSKDGAFDDVKIADVVGPTNNSKIIAALRRDGVTIGNIGTGVNNLYLDDVYEYSDYDKLPSVLKKLLAKEGLTPLPGDKVTANPFEITRMVVTDHLPQEYDYIILSDGQFKEGVEPGKETVNDLINRTDYLKISDIKDSVEQGLFAYEDITVSKHIDSEDNVTWEANYTNPYSGTPARNENMESFEMNIHKPEEWEDIYVFVCNKPAKVKELDSSIDGMKLKDVMKIKDSDALWKVRNEPIKDGDKLFDSIKNNLYLSDIITDLSSVKFLNKIDPQTKISEIGTAVNNLKLLDAFDENIYNKDTGKGGTTWKYLLIEETETWIAGDYYKSDDIFNGYKCNEYTVGGSGNKGIDQLITNMTGNMKRVTMYQLKADGLIDANDGFLDNNIDPRYTLAPAFAAEGKTKYGHLTIKEFTDLINGGITVTP